MLQEETTSNVEGKTQESLIEESEGSQDYQSLYNSEVGNAKKQRQRAQSAEQKLAKLEETIKKQNEASLIEQNKFKELYENEKLEKQSYLDKAKQFDDFIATEKESLLSQLSEEDKEEFKDLPLKALKKVVLKLTSNVAEPMKPVAGAVKSPNMTKPYADMNELERKEWFNQTAGAAGIQTK